MSCVKESMKPKVVATIEARMSSSRLPGKVLLPALGEPMLFHLVRRLRAVSSIDAIVIATTVNDSDQPIIDFASTNEIPVYRGSEENVLERVIGAAEMLNAQVIVEITGDCPIIDHSIVDETIKLFLESKVNYVSNTLIRSFPDGMDTQVFSLETLKKSATLTSDPLDLEHVSRFIWQHPDIFSQLNMLAPSDLYWPELGLTLDEADDYRLLKKIIETLAPQNILFGCADVIALLKKNPEWVDINRKVLRKGDS